MAEFDPNKPSEPVSESTQFDPKKPYDVVDDTNVQPHERGVIDKLFGTTGPRYQLWPEKMIREMVGLPEKTIQAAASAPPGSREATEAMVGPAAETAMAFSPTGAAARTAKTAAVAAPSIEQLKTASRGAYEKLRSLDIGLKPGATGELQKDIYDDLIKDGFRELPGSSPSTFKMIQELTTPVSKADVSLMTVADLEAVRQALNKLGPPHSPEMAAAQRAIDKIDEYLLNLPEVPGISETARGNWASAKRGEIVQETIRRAVQRAEGAGVGANVDNAIRQEFRTRIRNNPKLWNRFDKNEQKEIERIMKPGISVDIARFLSRFGPRHILTGAAPAAALYHFGEPVSALTMAGVGEAAHQYAKRSTLNRAQRLEEDTRSRSPLGGGVKPRSGVTKKLQQPEALRGMVGGASVLPQTGMQSPLDEMTDQATGQ